MQTRDRIGLALLGCALWAAGTLIYRLAGASLFEESIAVYWLNTIVTGSLCTAIFFGLMKWRRIDSKDWLQGAICLALPGMIGEVPILANFAELMSNLQPATAGRYAAFLFDVYATVLGVTWLMSMKARPGLSSHTPIIGTEQ